MKTLTWIEMDTIAENMDMDMEKAASMIEEITEGFFNEYRIDSLSHMESMAYSINRYGDFMDIMCDYFYQAKANIKQLNENIRYWAKRERELNERGEN